MVFREIGIHLTILPGFNYVVPRNIFIVVDVKVASGRCCGLQSYWSGIYVEQVKLNGIDILCEVDRICEKAESLRIGFKFQVFIIVAEGVNGI